MFAIKKKAVLRDTDAAGIVFFGNYFHLSHDAYEAFMESIDSGLPQILKEGSYLLLVVHAEADYKQSLMFGQEYEIKIVVDQLGSTSFTLRYEFIDSTNQPVASLKTVHVATDSVTRSKIEIPEELRSKLTKAM